ncbi:MAG: TlpA family protein disulfide reductase [Acidobacteria bacterium]|nr:TlpA family protein disulfide reductase [Acidobacteriota bacterium]
MPRRILTLLLGALLALPALGGPAPDFSLRRTDGSVFRLKDHLGKQVILVDFWATWCGPCTKLLKKLQEMKDKYPDVLVVAISIDDAGSQAKVAQYIQGRGYTFTVLLDPDTAVCKMFNPQAGIPFTFIVDKKGEVAYTHTGYLPGQEKELAEKLEALRK